MTMQTVSLNRAYGGMQGYRTPAARPKRHDLFGLCPGLTPTARTAGGLVSLRTDLHACQREPKKANSQRLRRAWTIFVAPDTSPRGEDVPGDPANAYDFALVRLLYVDATQAPRNELPHVEYMTERFAALVAENFPSIPNGNRSRPLHAVTAHSPPRCAHPDVTRAQVPLRRSSPPRVPWGIKALGGYLGETRTHGRKHDAVA